jgi:hypothetical protein
MHGLRQKPNFTIFRSNRANRHISSRVNAGEWYWQSRQHHGSWPSQDVNGPAGGPPQAGVKAEARAEEFPADPLVIAERLRQPDDVGAGCLAHLRHGIDERKLGGEERVGR